MTLRQFVLLVITFGVVLSTLLLGGLNRAAPPEGFASSPVGLIPIPPEVPPTARLSASTSFEESRSFQLGKLIGSDWLRSGTPTFANLNAPITWPEPLWTNTQIVTLSIETSVPPVHIRLRFMRAPSGGIELGDIERDCWQRGWTFEGETPNCIFDASPDGERSILTFDLPNQPGIWYIIVEGIWLVPVDGSVPGSELAPILHAWWSFTVRRESIGRPVSEVLVSRSPMPLQPSQCKAPTCLIRVPSVT